MIDSTDGPETRLACQGKEKYQTWNNYIECAGIIIEGPSVYSLVAQFKSKQITWNIMRNLEYWRFIFYWSKQIMWNIMHNLEYWRHIFYCASFAFGGNWNILPGKRIIHLPIWILFCLFNFSVAT